MASALLTQQRLHASITCFSPELLLTSTFCLIGQKTNLVFSFFLFYSVKPFLCLMFLTGKSDCVRVLFFLPASRHLNSYLYFLKYFLVSLWPNVSVKHLELNLSCLSEMFTCFFTQFEMFISLFFQLMGLSYWAAEVSQRIWTFFSKNALMYK